MVSKKLTVCSCKETISISGGSSLSGLVAHATPDRRLRRIRVSKVQGFFHGNNIYLHFSIP